MVRRKDKVVDQLRGGVKQLLTANGVKSFAGAAAFKDRETIAIDGGATIGAKKTIIATGSTSATPGLRSHARADRRKPRASSRSTVCRRA